MKKGYKRILIYEIVIIMILILNSFIENILNKYVMIGLLIILIILFKKEFGLEKDRHRYTKDIIMEILIVYIISFIVFYIFGIIVGFYRVDNYINIYGLKTFIIPIALTIILKEYLRYNIIQKIEGSKEIYIVTILLFVMLDISPVIRNVHITKEGIFDLITLSILPSISNNVVASYITKRSGYKPNIVWLLISSLYVYVIPIIPNTGQYISALIQTMYPFILMLKIMVFYKKEDDGYLDRNYRKKQVLPVVISLLFMSVIVYLTSGCFRYYAIAIGSGSMTPKIKKGDVVIVDTKKEEISKVKVGNVVAYKHDNIVVVHRIVRIEKTKQGKVYYSKGDRNKDIDNYAIYENEIVGIVEKKIGLIGLPTVWLSEI